MSRLNDTAVPGSAVSVTMSGTNGADKEVQVVAASRSSILRPENSSSRREILPMRFRTSLPAGYSVDRQKFYLREADDSDEENEPLTPAIRSSKNGAPSGTKKKASAPAGRTEVLFKHEKPVMRERPHSARLFRQIAQDDPEFKVMYRNCNYRRMELTEDQEKWLEDREIERKQRSDTVARQLVAEVQARAEKKKNKDKDKAKDKGDKGKDKGDKGKGKKKDSGSKDATKDAPKAKYKSATHFMSRHFPQFEETAESTEDGHGLAPMRLLQLEEVAEVEATFQRYGLPIREAVLRKALVVPQDKPEAICLEGLREGAEGLMVNPLPPHLWRRLAAGKKGKKKRKGKK